MQTVYYWSVAAGCSCWERDSCRGMFAQEAAGGGAGQVEEEIPWYHWLASHLPSYPPPPWPPSSIFCSHHPLLHRFAIFWGANKGLSEGKTADWAATPEIWKWRSMLQMIEWCAISPSRPIFIDANLIYDTAEKKHKSFGVGGKLLL